MRTAPRHDDALVEGPKVDPSTLLRCVLAVTLFEVLVLLGCERGDFAAAPVHDPPPERATAGRRERHASLGKEPFEAHWCACILPGVVLKSAGGLVCKRVQCLNEEVGGVQRTVRQDQSWLVARGRLERGAGRQQFKSRLDLGTKPIQQGYTATADGF